MSEEKSKAEDLVEVSWTGRKLLIKRSLLDEWYHRMTYEEKVQYVKEHPYAEQPVNIQTFKPLKDMKIEKVSDEVVLLYHSCASLIFCICFSPLVLGLKSMCAPFSWDF